MLRSFTVPRVLSVMGTSALALVGAQPAFGSGLEVPDSGAVQVGRGGAWVAKADDPLAVYMNPASMSFQPTGFHVGAHLMIQDTCFVRKNEQGEPVSPGSNLPGPGAPNGPEAETCAQSIFPNPQIASVLRLTDELAIGIGFVAPHAVGNTDWGESVPFSIGGQDRTQPGPGRYLLVSQSSLIAFPTVSASYAIVPDHLSIGAGFTWGIGVAEFTSFTEATSARREDDFSRDIRASLSATDAFIPGAVVGVDWRADPHFQFGAWFRGSDSLSAKTDLALESNYWLAGGTKNDAPCPAGASGCNLTEVEEAGTIKVPIPMEAKLGFRYIHPRNPSPNPGPNPSPKKGEPIVSNSLRDEVFDVELDLTWANNSAMDAIEIRFNPGIAVKGTPGTVPENGDIPHRWKDVLGVRLGSDVSVVPDWLALRGGAFFESKGQDDADLNLDFHMGYKVGLSGGGTFRAGPVDLSLAYQHVFFGTLDNGGQGRVFALSGDATTGFRSQQPVNGGSLSSSLNEVALGATLRLW